MLPSAECIKADAAIHTLVMGDFNCKIHMKQSNDEKCIGTHGLVIRNPTDTMILTKAFFFKTFTFFYKKDNRKWTSGLMEK